MFLSGLKSPLRVGARGLFFVELFPVLMLRIATLLCPRFGAFCSLMFFLCSSCVCNRQCYAWSVALLPDCHMHVAHIRKASADKIPVQGFLIHLRHARQLAWRRLVLVPTGSTVCMCSLPHAHSAAGWHQH